MGQSTAPTFGDQSVHSLDDKGRVIMPQRYRAALDGGYYLTYGLTDSCLWVFPLERWEQTAAEFDQQANAAATALTLDAHQQRHLERMLFTGTQGALDRQGRISIPQHFREFAGLSESTDALIAGVRNRIEIWNPELWRQMVDGWRPGTPLVNTAAQLWMTKRTEPSP